MKHHEYQLFVIRGVEYELNLNVKVLTVTRRQKTTAVQPKYSAFFLYDERKQHNYVYFYFIKCKELVVTCLSCLYRYYSEL